MATLLVSALALVVSAATFYRTQLRRTAALVGWVAVINQDDDEEGGAAITDYAFALSNSGAVDLLVREASVYLTGSAAQLVPEIPSDNLPLVLKPGEVKLIHLSLPTRFVENMAATAGAAVSVELQIYAASGKLYIPRKLVVSGEQIPSDLWAPFKLGKPKR